MKLRIMIKEGEYRLSKAGVMDAKIDAEELFCFMRNWDRVMLFLHKDEEVDKESEEQYFTLIQTRSERVPLQHITGRQEFMGYAFKVRPEVLIPRQDTETLVTEAAKAIRQGHKSPNSDTEKTSFFKAFKRPSSYNVLDLCCGSGAIGISLALICDGISVTAADISQDALLLAAENAKALRTDIELVKGDMFEAIIDGDRAEGRKLGAKVEAYRAGAMYTDSEKFPVEFGGRKGKGKGSEVKTFDMIVSNPPYIKTNSIAMLQSEVKDFEPISALDGGRDGLDFYRTIVEKSADFLKQNGWLMLEIGHDQGESLRKMIMDSGKFTIAEIVKDVPGKDRVVKCRKL